MSLHSRALTAHVAVSIWLLVNCFFSSGIQRDIDCLRSIRNSLQDPMNNLSPTWNFNNGTQEGFICKFEGIDCWNPDENRVLNIRLSDMGLKGEFPVGLELCSALTGLDLSSNNIYGNIPSNISKLIQFVVSLDLSSNQLSGPIPGDLANCSFLNSVKLDNNRLTGPIPPEIGLLDRLKTFSVSNNQLTGPVPVFRNDSVTVDYSNNPGLCGKPHLPVCQGPSKKART